MCVTISNCVLNTAIMPDYAHVYLPTIVLKIMPAYFTKAYSWCLTSCKSMHSNSDRNVSTSYCMHQIHRLYKLNIEHASIGLASFPGCRRNSLETSASSNCIRMWRHGNCNISFQQFFQLWE